MRCYRAKKLISAYVDGELDPRRRKALEAHLGDCQDCSAELERARQQWLVLAELDPAPDLDPDSWKQMLTALEESRRMPWYRRQRIRIVQAIYVIVFAALGFLGGALLSWGPAPARDARVTRPMAERALVAEAFDASAFGLAATEEVFFECVPR